MAVNIPYSYISDISYLEFKLTEKNLKGNFPRVGVQTLSSVYDDKTGMSICRLCMILPF